jgi:acetyltransferase
MFQPQPSRNPADSHLRALFAPRSVAVVGASNDLSKMGGLYFEHLLASFEGTSYPVNRGGLPVQGVPSFASLSTLPETPDLVFVAVPAQAAVAVTKDAANLGVPVVVVHTAGFSEMGAEGAALETELTEYARARGTRVVGPNSMGVYGGATGVNLLGLPARAGGVAFVSASGTLIEMVVPRLNESGLGLRNVVGFENQADLRIDEYLDYCADDPGVDVIAVYMEAIKDGSGRTFVDVLRRAAERKPVVVLRGGRTAAGQRAAISHTGAIVSPSLVYEGLLRQAGIVELEDEAELVPFIEGLSMARWAPSSRVAVMGNGGGFATLVTDAAESFGLSVPRLSPDVQAALRDVLNPLAAVGNPIDAVVEHEGDVTLWGELAEIVLRDDIGAVLKFGLYAGGRSVESIRSEAAALAKAGRSAGVPVFVYSPYGDADDDTVEVFRSEGIPVFRTQRTAARVISASATLGGAGGDVTRRVPERLEQEVTAPGTDVTVLDEPESLQVVELLGLPVPPHVVLDAHQLKGADSLDLQLSSGEVVLKVVIDGVHHKSDVGGVRTHVPRERALAEARAMAESLAVSDYEVAAVIVMEQVSAAGPELLLSARRDPAVGPIVTVGAGGVLAELLSDVAVAAAPLSVTEAECLLDSLRVGRLLQGYRGSEHVGLVPTAEAIAAFSQSFVDDPSLSEVEVNPLMASAEGLWAVDALVRREEGAGC